VDDGKQMNCQSCRAGMEDYLEEYLTGSAEQMDDEPELTAHLRDCSACRQAFDNGLLANRIVRYGCEPHEGISGAFVTRVMAAIRDEEARRAATGAIWRPVELLASRFALAASVLLLAASVYLVEFAPPFEIPAVSETAVSSLMPEPPAQPSNQDEVLMSLVEMENGY
jgi:predicted anti-sigma-YlaC factor YlaD